MSCRARGLLMVMLSFPPDWETTVDSLWREMKAVGGAAVEGREALRGAARELERLGYLVRRRVQGARGRWSTELELYSTPQPVDPVLLPVPGENGSSAGAQLAPAPKNRAPVDRAPVDRPSAHRSSSTPKDRNKNLSLAGCLRAAGVDDAEEREIIEWIEKTRPDVRSPRAYLRTVAGNGDLPGLVAEWRQAAGAAAPAAGAGLPEWCGRCGLDSMPLPDGRVAAAVNPRLRFVDTRGTPCPDCHPAGVAAS